MLDFLFELLGELLIQLVLELLVELGVRAVKHPLSQTSNAWLTAFGYLLCGALLGGVSVLILPHHFITTKALRVANIVLSPMVAGAAMSAMGAWRARRGQLLLAIDRFAYGYLFALGIALVRFWFAQ